MAPYLLSLSKGQIARLAGLIEALSARDFLGFAGTVPQCHDTDVECANQVRRWLYAAAQRAKLAFIDVWCILWPRADAELPPGALPPSVLARDWRTARRKYAGSGGGYACMRIALCDYSESHRGPFMTAFAMAERTSRSFITWLMENTQPCVDQSREWDAHDAHQWAVRIGRELQSWRFVMRIGLPMLTFDEDRWCAGLIQRCPRRLFMDAVTQDTAFSGGPALVRAHVISAHQTSAAIQAMFDRDAYDQALTAMWSTIGRCYWTSLIAPGSALRVAVQLKSWTVVVHLAYAHQWRAAAVAGAIIEYYDVTERSADEPSSDAATVPAVLASCLSNSVDAVDHIRSGIDISPASTEDITCDSLRGAMLSCRVDDSVPSYASYIDALVAVEMCKMIKTRPYNAAPLQNHASGIRAPSRVLLLAAAAASGSADTILAVRRAFRLTLSVDMLLDTNLIPDGAFGASVPGKQTTSVLQVCGCHADDMEGDVMCALFSQGACVKRQDSGARGPQDCGGGGGGSRGCVGAGDGGRSGGGGGGEGGDGDGGSMSVERTDVMASVGPRKLDIIRQALLARSAHGLAWAVTLPANSDEEEADIKEAVLRYWTTSKRWPYDLTIQEQEVVEHCDLAVHLARFGLDPFQCLTNHTSSLFQEAFIRQWNLPGRFKRNVGPPLAFRLAAAYAYHRNIGMDMLFRHGHIRQAFSVVMSYALHKRVLADEHQRTMLAAIASLSNWRIWGPAVGIDPIQPPGFSSGGRGSPGYDESCVYSVFVSTDGEMTTTFSEKGRECAAQVTRFGHVPYQHNRVTRAQVVSALVLVSRPRSRARLIEIA